jgi:hypothetical protein
MAPQTRGQDALQAAEQKAHEASTLLQGQLPNTDGDVAIGHPIHPGTVHWPIAVSFPPQSPPYCKD